MKKLFFLFISMFMALSANAFYSGQFMYTILSYTDDTTGLREVAVSGLNPSVALQDPLFIPSSVTYDGKSYLVRSIATGVFKGNTSITQVVLSAGLKEIGVSAFEGCTGITQVTIPSTVTTIGTKAFANCGTLRAGFAWLYGYAPTVSIASDAFSGTTLTACVPTVNPQEAALILSNNVLLTATNNGARVVVDPTLANDGGSLLNADRKYIVTKMPTPSAQGETTMVGGKSGITYVKTDDENIAICWSSATSTYLTCACTAIAPYAFYNNTSLAWVYNVSYADIGENAFYGCTNLQRFEVKSGSIGYRALIGCTKLWNLKLGSNDETRPLTLGNSVFQNCTALDSVIIYKNVTQLYYGTAYNPYYTFSGCTNLKKFIVDSNNTVYSAYYNALYTKDQSTLLYVPQNYQAINGVFSSQDFSPNTKTIGHSAIRNNKNIKHLSIRYGITTIDSYACDGTPLTEVTIPSSVTTIRTSAFGGLTSSSSIYAAWLDDSLVPTLGSNAFGTAANNAGIKIYLPTQGAKDNVPENTSLKAYSPTYYVNADKANDLYYNHMAFVVTKAPTTSATGTMALVGGTTSSVTITAAIHETLSTWFTGGTAVPNKIYCDEVAAYAFYNNANVTGVSINTPSDNGVKSIDVYAFYGCKNMTSITLNCPATIRTRAFYLCPAVTSITIYDNANSVKGILDGAFAEPFGSDDAPTGSAPKNITQVTIPRSLTSFTATAFVGTKLQKYIVSSSSTTYSGYNGALYNKAQTQLVHVAPYDNTLYFNAGNMPATLTTFNAYCFYGTAQTYGVEIPYGVTSVGNYAFSYSNVESINFPSSVTTYNVRALANNPRLNYLGVNVLDETQATASDDMMEYVPSTTMVYYGNYQPTTTNWKKLKIISHGAYDLCFDTYYHYTMSDTEGCVDYVRGFGGKGFNIPSGDVTIPEVVTYRGKEYIVLNVGAYAFRTGGYYYSGELYDEENTTLTSVTLPFAVLSIGAYAFYDCPNLTKVALPGMLQAIGKYCFENTGIETYHFPYGLKTIGNYAICSQQKAKSVYIPSSVESYDNPVYYALTIGAPSDPLVTENLYINLTIDKIVGGTNSRYTNNLYIPYEEYANNLSQWQEKFPNATIKPGAHDFEVYDSSTGTAWGTVTKAASGNTQQTAGEAKFVYGRDQVQTLGANIGTVQQEAAWVVGAYPGERRYYNMNSIDMGAFKDCVQMNKVTLNVPLTSIPDDAFMNTIQLYSFPFNDLDEDISIGNQAFYGSGIQGDVVLKTKSSVGVNAFASCKRLNSLLFTHTMNTGPYVNISTTKNIYGDMSSSFRCYVPLNIFYAKAPYVYNSSTNATDAEQLMPYLTADADSKYQIVCFPTVKNYSGKDVYSLNIDLGPYFKAGGKLYRVGCKTQNPVNASGIVDLAEVKPSADNDYLYSVAYNDEGYVLEMEAGKYYKLSRSYGLSNLANSDTSVSQRERNLLFATSKSSTTNGLLEDIEIGTTTGKVNYMVNKKVGGSLREFSFEKVTKTVQKGLTLSGYINFTNVSQTNPAPADISVIRFVMSYDLNNDGKVSTADIQVIINEMKKAQASQNMAYDLNADGKISTADIQVIINEMKK